MTQPVEGIARQRTVRLTGSMEYMTENLTEKLGRSVVESTFEPLPTEVVEEANDYS